MSDRPDEQDPLEHLLDNALLEQRHVRIHSRHIDMDLAEGFLLALVPVRFREVLVHQFQVVDPLSFQDGVAALEAGRQVA